MISIIATICRLADPSVCLDKTVTTSDLSGRQHAGLPDGCAADGRLDEGLPGLSAGRLEMPDGRARTGAGMSIQKKKFDWVDAWILVLVLGCLTAIGIGFAVELLKLAALVKYVFS